MTRHVVIDPFLTSDEVLRANAAWPAPDWPGWVGLDALDPAYAGKRASDLQTPLPGFLASLLLRMADVRLGAMLGMSDAVADLSLVGAGLFAYPPGVGLASHVDADAHRRLGQRRAWSAVLWVHAGWDAGWGGELVLEAPPACEWVGCVPGRLACFDCRSRRHHVEAVRCPSGMERRCLALFGFLPVEVTHPRRARADFGRSATISDSEGQREG